VQLWVRFRRLLALLKIKTKQERTKSILSFYNLQNDTPVHKKQSTSNSTCKHILEHKYRTGRKWFWKCGWVCEIYGRNGMRIVQTVPSTTTIIFYPLNFSTMKTKKNYTWEVILVFTILWMSFLWLLALDKSHIIEAKRNCDSIYQNLEHINTEATPERLDLENAYFQLWCAK